MVNVNVDAKSAAVIGGSAAVMTGLIWALDKGIKKVKANREFKKVKAEVEAKNAEPAEETETTEE